MGGKIWKWRSTGVLHVCQEGGKIGNLENTTCSRIFEGKEGARTVSLHFPPTDLESFPEEVAITRTEGSLRLSGLLLKWTFFCLTWAFGQNWSHSLQIEVRYEVNLSLRLKSHRNALERVLLMGAPCSKELFVQACTVSDCQHKVQGRREFGCHFLLLLHTRRSNSGSQTQEQNSHAFECTACLCSQKHWAQRARVRFFLWGHGTFVQPNIPITKSKFCSISKSKFYGDLVYTFFVSHCLKHHEIPLPTWWHVRADCSPCSTNDSPGIF